MIRLRGPATGFALALVVAGASPAASEPAPCPPADRPASHCVLLVPRDGSRKTREALRRVAAADGIRLEPEGDHPATQLSDERIRALFGARVVYRRTAASASNTGEAGVCAAYLEDVRLPRRYARLLQSITIGHQICE